MLLRIPNGQQLKRDHRHRSYAFTYSKLGGISKEIMKSDHARSVYFCPLYDKSCEYLRGEAKIDELTKAFDNSTESYLNYGSTSMQNLESSNW